MTLLSIQTPCRYVGGTKIGAKRVSSASACGQLTITTEDAYTFNFALSSKTCTMFADGDEDMNKVKDSRYYAGFLDCDDY